MTIISITNADLESVVQQRGPGGQAGPTQPLLVFALKDFAGITVDHDARKALSALARKITKAVEKESEAKTELIEDYGTKDESGNLVVKSEDLEEPRRAEWKAAIKAWRTKTVIEVEPIGVPIYAEDVEFLNPEFMSALSEIAPTSIRDGVKPDSLQKQIEKLKKENGDLRDQIKSITETVTKKKE